MHHADFDTDKIDEAVLALMFLTLHDEDRLFGMVRAWKSFDWDALDRLHAQDMILDPVGILDDFAMLSGQDEILTPRRI